MADGPTSPHREGEIDPLADPEEKRVLFAALDSFRRYRQAAHYNITHVRRQSFFALPSAHSTILSAPPISLTKTFDAVDAAIASNADIAEAILAVGLPCFGVDSDSADWTAGNHATPSDLDKARSTIRQLYRDWSQEGLPERHAAFAPFLSALSAHFPNLTAKTRHACRVLVPGAGLGRLVFELCLAGYTVEGNEISYHQLLASNYILNFAGGAGTHTLYPWALNFSNHRTRAQQLAAVKIPDVDPAAELAAAAEGEAASEVHYSERMSMTSGDFCVLYRQPEYAGAFTAVATCFFLDTAPNVLRYFETVRHCLQEGGLWINLGPLLWHFESAPTPAEREMRRKQQHDHSHNQGEHAHDHHHEAGAGPADRDDGIGEPGSFELAHDEVLTLLAHCGFDVVEQGDARPTGYIQDPASLLQNVYRPVFWVARKRKADLPS